MSDLLITVVLLSLAVWRLWRAIAVDDITEPIRARFMWRGGRRWGRLMDGLMCAWCLGFWLSGSAVATWMLVAGEWSLWWFVVCWFAVSALVGILNITVDRLSSEG